MILGKVIGTVWGAKQSETLIGRRVVEVRPIGLEKLVPGDRVGNDVDEPMLNGRSVLAVDPLGADTGQAVLVSIGSRVRDLVAGRGVATKNCVVAIVDAAAMESL